MVRLKSRLELSTELHVTDCYFSFDSTLLLLLFMQRLTIHKWGKGLSITPFPPRAASQDEKQGVDDQ